MSIYKSRSTKFCAHSQDDVWSCIFVLKTKCASHKSTAHKMPCWIFFLPWNFFFIYFFSIYWNKIIIKKTCWLKNINCWISIYMHTYQSNNNQTEKNVVSEWVKKFNYNIIGIVIYPPVLYIYYMCRYTFFLGSLSMDNCG